MDIGRVDPDLIVPAEAGERGTKTVLERQPTAYRQPAKRRLPAAAEADEDEENGAGTTPVYTQDGHLQEGKQDTATVHYIDFTA